MSTFGNNLKLSLFGASHEKYIGLTIHNYPAGILIDELLIKERLKLRTGLNSLTSKRFEEDNYEIISGVFNGISTGAPITFLVDNNDVKSEDYLKNYGIARPSHADYTYYKKYHGFSDYRGGGVSSGRLTVVLIILGALCEQLLVDKNIIVASHIKSIYNIQDENFEVDDDILKAFKSEIFPVSSDKIKEKMLDKIQEMVDEKDSVGGIVETFIKNLPTGLGEPFFDSFESIISHLMFSIPGVKGIEFGTGFDLTKMQGSLANDQMQIINGSVGFITNHNGGINGGITNGDIVVFRTAFKPTSSIGKEQDTINFLTNQNQKVEIKGRHDVIIAIKGLHVVNALTNYAVLEMMMGNKL